MDLSGVLSLGHTLRALLFGDIVVQEWTVTLAKYLFLLRESKSIEINLCFRDVGSGDEATLPEHGPLCRFAGQRVCCPWLLIRESQRQVQA